MAYVIPEGAIPEEIYFNVTTEMYNNIHNLDTFSADKVVEWCANQHIAIDHNFHFAWLGLFASSLITLGLSWSIYAYSDEIIHHSNGLVNENHLIAIIFGLQTYTFFTILTYVGYFLWFL